jgi:hypothetical protein
VLSALPFAAFAVTTAVAGHMPNWKHDHSKRGVPPRPNGIVELNRKFGPRCSPKASSARSYWPHAYGVGQGGFVYYNAYLARNIGHNVRLHIGSAHRYGALYPGIGAYNCRLISGSTSWSTHSWGAAVDTNWLRNPMGQSYWNGRGADGVDYGRYIPDVWRGKKPGHRFFWGLNWSRPDPMHFQYVINY